MNNFFQNRYLWLVILGLLLFNLGLLGWIWFSPQNGLRMGQSPGEFLEQKLNFTAEQKEQYRLLREDHHSRVKTIRDSVGQMKKHLFEQIEKPLGDPDVTRITAEIAQRMATVDEITFRHFRDIRLICTPVQKQKFDEIIEELLHHLGSEGRGGTPDGLPPPPHGAKPPHQVGGPPPPPSGR